MTQLTKEHLDSELAPIKAQLKMQNVIIGAIGTAMSLAMTIVITIMVVQTSSINSAIENIGTNGAVAKYAEQKADANEKAIQDMQNFEVK